MENIQKDTTKEDTTVPTEKPPTDLTTRSPSDIQPRRRVRRDIIALLAGLFLVVIVSVIALRPFTIQDVDTEHFQNCNNMYIGPLIILEFAVAVVFITNKMWRDKQIKKAEKKCEEYMKYACGRIHESPSNTTNKSAQIVLGNDAPLGMFPHMAMIIIQMKQNFSYCGGSLISENFVLSAAHCISNQKNYTLRIRLGNVNSLDNDSGEWFGSNETHIHPWYDDEHSQYDILLIKLDREVKFSNITRPICLNTKYQNNYERAIASGWGMTENGSFSLHLKKVELNIIERDKCCELLEKKCHSNFICASSPDSSKSPNQGDAGGPLQVVLNKTCPNTYEEIGVINSMQNLTTKMDHGVASFYIKVAAFVPWIANIVWPDES